MDARRGARLGEGMVQVVEVDPHDEPLLRTWWETHRAFAQDPSPYRSRRLAKGAEHVQQDDTLVMPEHRGARLGTLLELATLDAVRRDHPERRALHTWTEPDNHAMYRTNTDVGYRPVERMPEMQLRDGGVGRR